MKYHLEIAEFTRSLQSSNGLRHGDYNRYRHFCSRKIRRIRSSLDIVNGRHKFRKAELPSVVNSVRFIQIFVLLAERAWAHGLTLKSEYALGESKALGTVRHKFMRKFRRAAKAASEALDLAKQVGDSRCILEAEAYHSWMTAIFMTECGQYERALEQVELATTKYGELAKSSLDVIFPTASKAYKHRISDLEPVSRVCKYKLRLSHAVAVPEEREENLEEDFESVYEMSEGDVEFSESSDEMEDADDPISPKSSRGPPNEGLLGKIGGWWSKS